MDRDFLEIPGYRPNWIDNTEAFIEAHGSMLDGFVGRKIESIHVLWDLNHDEHFCEGPVVVHCTGMEPLEVCARNLADLSVTRGRIDLARRVKWNFMDEPWIFEWRRDPLPSIASALGQRVLAVEVLENELVIGRGQCWCLGGIEMITPAGGLAVFNGLDETRVALSAQPSGWRRVDRPGRQASR